MAGSPGPAHTSPWGADRGQREGNRFRASPHLWGPPSTSAQPGPAHEPFLTTYPALLDGAGSQGREVQGAQGASK